MLPNTQPSAGQKQAGNYRMKHIRWNGLPITIENVAGSSRSGIGHGGKKWCSLMHYDYGYIKGTKGKDGDHIDVFIGPNAQAPIVWIVNQVNPKTRKFDEHKCMLGFDTKEQAKEAYLKNYDRGWKGLGSIVGMPVKAFKAWVRERRRIAPVKVDRPKTSNMAGKYQRTIEFLRKDDLDPRTERGSRSWNAVNTGLAGAGLAAGAYATYQGAKTARSTDRVVRKIEHNIDPILKNAASTAKNAASITGQVDRGLRGAKAGKYLAKKRIRGHFRKSPVLRGLGLVKKFSRPMTQVTQFRNPYREWDGKTGINPKTGKFEDNRSTLRKAAPLIVGGGVALAGSLAVRRKFFKPKVPFEKGTHPLAGTPFEPKASSAAREMRHAQRLTENEGEKLVRNEIKKIQRKDARKSAKEEAMRRLNGGVRTRGFSGKLNRERIVNFNLRNPDYNWEYTASLDPRTHYRKANTIRRWANRGGEVARDIDDMVSGRPRDPKKKRFYEKSWFKNAALTTGIAAGTFGATAIAARRGGYGFSGKLRNVVNFDFNADMAGWDVRDPRGKSARVFAPGSKKRTRRKKEPHERIDHIRKTRNIAIAAALAGTGIGAAGVLTNPRINKHLLPTTSKTYWRHAANS